MRNNNYPEEKRIMVLTVQHPYDSVEVLGVFDDKETLKKACLAIVDKDEYLISDIVGNLHIFECPINKLTGDFYPNDYDDPNSIGVFMENQDDICKEVLDEDFFSRRGLRSKFGRYKMI